MGTTDVSFDGTKATIAVIGKGFIVSVPMMNTDELHPDFERCLSDYQPKLQRLYRDIRKLVLSVHEHPNELLYNSHALTSAFSLSEKLKDAFCHIALYSKHINLGFNSGALLDDPSGILKGTGTKIRHIPFRNGDGLESEEVRSMLERSVEFAQKQLDETQRIKGQTFSKIKA